MNVLIRASRDKTEHKMRENLNGEERMGHAWWTVNGTLRQADSGDTIMFSDGERVYAEAEILEVVEGKIVFNLLDKVDKPNPRKPPTRGFAYCS